MTIERLEGEIIIKIPDSVDIDSLQRLLNYLSYTTATANSKTERQDEVDQLSREANKSWWEENKGRLLKQ